MRVPISWLKEFIELKISVKDLAKRLTMAGFEVEAIEDLSSLAEGVLVGYVVEKFPHPNSKKLSVCKVDIGRSDNLQIVCGASNIKQGVYVPVAAIGVYLPKVDLKIKHAEIRGIESEGMICSLEELGIEDKSEGIYIFNDSHNLLKIGNTITSLFGLNDKVLEIAITANRPDGMSIYGIANEVGALTGRKSSIPKVKIEEAKKENNNNISIDLIDKDSLYSLTLIENIEMNTVNINKVTNMLKKCNIKSINPIVDITNYIMIETGQPLHAFDADKLNQLCNCNVKYENFGLRMAKEGEKFNALDNKIHSLNEKNAITTCNDIPIAIAGVIGGKDTAVTLETKRVWIECAGFRNSIIRISSRDLGVRSESSGRFEKGVVTEQPLSSLNRAYSLFKEYFDCNKVSTSYSGEIITSSLSITLRRDRVINILGPLSSANSVNNEEKDKVVENKYNLSDLQISRSLNSIGCKLEDIDEGWNVEVPFPRRKDLKREIDLIEEISRLIGYDNFQSTIPHPIRPGILSPKQKAERLLRDSLSSLGFNELTTMSLVGKDTSDINRIPITNPLLSDTSYLRTNLWEELLSVCNRNIKAGSNYCWIFEIGSLYIKDKSSIKEVKRLAGLLSGNNTQGSWKTAKKKKEIDYYEARGKLAEAFHKLRIEINDIQTNKNNILHPGRAAELICEGKSIGTFGQLHPEIATKENLPSLTYLFDIDFVQLIKAATRKSKWMPKFKEYQTVPSTYRDISLLIKKDITSKELTNIIRKAGKTILEEVELIDRYEDEKIGDNICSLTFRITYRGDNKTLKDEDVEPIHENVREALQQAFECELKS